MPDEDGIKVTVVGIRGQSAIVMYDDRNADVSPIACIIDRGYLGSALPGSAVYIDGEAIAESTSYGLDWSIFFPEGFTISAKELHAIMYSRGILTLEDLKSRSAEIPEIVLQLTRVASIKLYDIVKRELGG